MPLWFRKKDTPRKKRRLLKKGVTANIRGLKKMANAHYKAGITKQFEELDVDVPDDLLKAVRKAELEFADSCDKLEEQYSKLRGQL